MVIVFVRLPRQRLHSLLVLLSGMSNTSGIRQRQRSSCSDACFDSTDDLRLRFMIKAFYHSFTRFALLLEDFLHNLAGLV